MKLKIATRRSKLSIKQVEIVINALKRKIKELETELVFVETKGDKFGELPPVKIGSKGIFEKEVNIAVLKGDADVAVHSLKDVPLDVSKDLTLAAVLPRGSPFEALVSKNGLKLEDLPHRATVGTSSIRRKAALLNLRSDLNIKDLRGNVDTRIKKLEKGLYDAILIAKVGLERLGLRRYITQVFSPIEITPAPCQGIIATYARRDDERTLSVLKAINDEKTLIEAKTEREIVRRIGGGCFTPLGVFSKVEGKIIELIATLYSPNGFRKVTVSKRGRLECLNEVIEYVSERLFKEGREILSKMRKD